MTQEKNDQEPDQAPDDQPNPATTAPEPPKESSNSGAAESKPRGWMSRWTSIPLYWRILLSLAIGLIVGLAMGPSAQIFQPISNVILQLLSALAPPLILIAVVHVLMTSDIPRGSVGKLAGLLLLNTTVAIFIGLGVANILQPGKGASPDAADGNTVATAPVAPPPAGQADVGQASGQQPSQQQPSDPGQAQQGGSEGSASEGNAAEGQESSTSETSPQGANTGPQGANTGPQGASTGESSKPEVGGPHSADGPRSPIDQLLRSVPHSILGPLGDSQNVIGVIIIAVAFGIALRNIKSEPLRNIEDLIELAYRTLLVVLHWIIELVPLGVACVVASVIGEKGFEAFWSLGAFVVAVLIALALQTCWYLIRIKLFSWVSPLRMLIAMRDALTMAFSTDSSTATMPVTYACLREKVGVREENASLGALVGANFNNDGTALYEAMAALFIAQMVGLELDFSQQLLIVFTSIIASVGAAGIPEAGIVTLTLVFNAVGLPVSMIPILLTVDWFLDRCRTTINVLGDVNVSCILDGRTREAPAPPDAAETAA